MTGNIRRCPIDKTYTLLKVCPKCGADTESAHPARYSPQDKFGKYRREVKLRNRLM